MAIKEESTVGSEVLAGSILPWRNVESDTTRRHAAEVSLSSSTCLSPQATGSRWPSTSGESSGSFWSRMEHRITTRDCSYREMSLSIVSSLPFCTWISR